ncbi:MAG: hypothetical protein L6Q45_12665 [Anaerolineales bacterium]|nr:hypothetical protein [Anaerolineales bacterium]
MELPEFPDKFHPEMPIGLRIALMSFVVREIRSDFMNHIPEMKKEVMQNNKNMSGVDAFLYLNNQIEKRTAPYIKFIREKELQMSATLQNANDLEKAGQVEGAISLFEKLANEGFTAPMPHERLRVIYTKQREFEKAVFACERYISILNEFHKFDPHFSNIHLIPRFENNIAKLKAKIK